MSRALIGLLVVCGVVLYAARSHTTYRHDLGTGLHVFTGSGEPHTAPVWHVHVNESGVVVSVHRLDSDGIAPRGPFWNLEE